MAVTTLTATQLVKNTMSDTLPIAGGTAIDPTKTMEVAYPQDGKLLLVINNTTATAKNVTISAGGFTIANVQGPLVQAMAQNDVRYVIVGSDRFKKQSGVLELAFEASMTGFVQAFLIP